MNNVTPIPVRLEAFEGPLDLLLHLIDKNKINIYDIPVSEITDQYLDYVQQMKEEKLEVTSEFLVMAATLLDLKSRMLLPREEEEEEEQGDPREELVQRLLDYKLTKYQSEELKDKSLEASKNVFRAQDLPREVKEYQPPLDYDELLGETTLKSLTKIFEDVLKRQK
ncbi:MAG: segregation and condensation protein A, partial [bacterium]